MIEGAIAEVATLGTVEPFLVLLADPGVADKYSLMDHMSFLLGGSSFSVLLSFAIIFGIISVIACMEWIWIISVCLRIAYGLSADIGG